MTTILLLTSIFLSLLLFFYQAVNIVATSIVAIDRSIKKVHWKVSFFEEIWLMAFSLTTLYASHYLLTLNPI